MTQAGRLGALSWKEDAVVIKRMDHFTIVTPKLNETLAFYTELLGLKDGPRPDFGVQGLWFYIGDHPVLHVIEVEKMPASVRGGLDHMAYWAEGFVETAAKLDAAGVPWRVIRVPRPYSTWQIFFNDPNGVEVELDFHADEPPPENWKQRAGMAPRDAAGVAQA
jgi:catechol 2,3-dioxygenase-like lactoylglutathione lyase family enzyme